MKKQKQVKKQVKKQATKSVQQALPAPPLESVQRAKAPPSLTPIQRMLPDTVPMKIPEVAADYPELHTKMRDELDPESILVSDEELTQILQATNLIPYRAINRCLIVMEQRARGLGGDGKLVLHVRYLKMKFSDGLLKLNEERHASRC